MSGCRGRRSRQRSVVGASVGVMVGLVTMVAGACSLGDDAAPGSTTERPGPTSTTEVSTPEFSGDAESPFCRLSAELVVLQLEDTPEALREFYVRFDERSGDLLDAAPEEIADDVEVFIDGVSSIRGALERVGFDSSQIDDADVPALRDPAFPTAGNRVVAYAQQVCNGEVPAERPGG